jgi:hypothetical protein
MIETPEIPENGTDSYSEIGTLLRNARQEMRLSLPEAGRMLHIRMRYLESLEEGHLDDLPGLTYVKGYLQAYATFLSLDKDEILRRFEGVERHIARRGLYFPQVFSKEKTPNPVLVWGGLAAALAAYAFWGLVLQDNHPKLSVVERIAEKPPEKVRLTAKMAQDVACLHASDVLYPPCTMARDDRFDLLPQSRWNSVMDLATY